MVKTIMSYSRVIDTQGVDQTLFTGGPQGLLFTASEQSGLTIKITPSSGGTITTSGILTGAGLGFGDSLVVNGAGYLVTAMWGELREYYRLVNTNQLEVIVASSVTVGSSGMIGAYPAVSGEAIFVPAGIYSDNNYSINYPTVTWS